MLAFRLFACVYVLFFGLLFASVGSIHIHHELMHLSARTDADAGALTMPHASLSDFWTAVPPLGEDRGYSIRRRCRTIEGTSAITAEGAAAQGAEVTVVLGGFSYVKDEYGRVLRAFGNAATNGQDPNAAVQCWLDAAYYYSKNAERDRNTWQAGHIIARSLGGRGWEPLNFFNHHLNSNSNNSPYWRIENIVNAMNLLFAANNINNCPIAIQVSFNYPANGVRFTIPNLPDYVPTGGTYRVTISQACGNQYLGLNIPPHTQQHPNPNAQFQTIARTWMTNAYAIEEPVGTWFYRVSQPWINGSPNPAGITHGNYPIVV